MEKRGSLIPAAPIRQVVEAWCEKNPDLRVLEGGKSVRLGRRTIICQQTGVKMELLGELLSGEKQWINFDIAERIVLGLGETWDFSPELRELYDSYDLSSLDKKKPVAA